MSRETRGMLDRIDRLFGRGIVAAGGEEDLLSRYSRDRDEDAFSAIVARHGPMVLGVCRRLLRDERDAEDAFQATFLVLARRSAAIGDASRLGGWLHGVAHRVAVRARARAARRFAHEQAAEEPIEPAVEEHALAAMERRELAAIVDEELSRLPTTLRDPVVLCYLEGLTHDEAARQLRWPVGTVRSRMARARQVLGRRLARRGVVADEAALASTLALSRPTVPPEWLAATVRGALEFATRPATAAAAIASARSAALARRTLMDMLITKLSMIGAVGLSALLTVGAAGVGAMPAFRAQEPPKPTGDAPPSAKAATVDPPGANAEALAADLQATRDRLLSLESEAATLRQHLGEVEARLKQLPSSRTETASPPAGPVKAEKDVPGRGEKGDEGGGRPTYAQVGSGYMVISPDGSRVVIVPMLVGRDFSNPVLPVQLPPIMGVRREVLIPDHAKLRPPGGKSNVGGHAPDWFTALDLDRDRRVTRILAFRPYDMGDAIIQVINPPVDRSSFVAISESVCTLGRTVFGFSQSARRWGSVTLPAGVSPVTRVSGYRVWGEGDRLFIFKDDTATWEDVYARAMGGEATSEKAPAGDLPKEPPH